MAQLEVSLRRIVVGYRLIAAAWMAVLGVITLVRSERVERPGVVVGILGVVAAWTIITALWSYRRPDYLASAPYLVADLALSVAALLAPDVAGSDNFYGGYPTAVIFAGVYASGMRGGGISAAVLTLTAIARVAGGGIVGDATGVSGAVLVYPFIAIPAIWAIGVLRRSDRLRREAQEALAGERAERARVEERAEVAAHLHDSVLQTLALIQRSSGKPDEVVALARGQERDLRRWLFGGTDGHEAGLGPALTEMCAQLERQYRRRVELVVVGDAPMTDRLAALVGAAREAIVNACRHSGADVVSVYAEVADGLVTVFVRDRGSGFVEADVPADRRGISESIRARLARHDGEVRISSQVGAGTEVELSMHP